MYYKDIHQVSFVSDVSMVISYEDHIMPAHVFLQEFKVSDT